MAYDPPIPSLPDEDYDYRILGWCNEAIQEGDAFLKAQVGYDKINETIAAVMGQNRDLKTSTLSLTTSNHLGKIAGDLAALMTDVKPFWDFRTYNPRFEKNSEIFGKLSSAWYLQRGIDTRFSEVIKYWEVGATGWAHPFYNEDTEDLDMSGEDPRDVLPIRPAGNTTLQDGMGVIKRRQRPVNYVRQKFGAKAARVQPDNDGSAVSMNLLNTRAGRLLDAVMASPFRRRLFGDDRPARELPRIPTCNLYTMYLADNSENTSSRDRVMGQVTERGEPATNWSYIVKPGEKLYPRKRCIVFTRDAILYDGPSIYWHGLFPYCKLTLDPWPWSWLGKAPLWDLLPLQRSLDKFLRIIDDWGEKMARPDLIADKNSTSKAAMDRIDTRRAGLKLQQNPAMGKGIQIVYPNPLPDSIFKQIEWTTNEMDNLSGVRDMSQMMRLNQVPSANTIEKAMEAMSPTVRGRSRAIEAFMREFGMMTAYNFAQFCDLPKRLTILGPDGVTREDFDFDPGSMIPDFVHKEDFDHRGIPTASALIRGPMPRYERAREFLRQFTYHVAPGSLLAASEIEEQMKYLQLARAGWIDIITTLEKLGIPNVGEPPKEAGTTILQRLQWQQSVGLGMDVGPAGRKASGQAPPRQVVKES